jgi:hypothetical protein
MLYPYNAIFGQGLFNTFEAALHLAYLCLKVPTTFCVITMCDCQKEARNIERGFALGTRMYIYLGKAHISMSHGSLRLNKKSQRNSRTQPKPKMNARECIGAEMSPKEQVELPKVPRIE